MHDRARVDTTRNRAGGLEAGMGCLGFAIEMGMVMKSACDARLSPKPSAELATMFGHEYLSTVPPTEEVGVRKKDGHQSHARV